MRLTLLPSFVVFALLLSFTSTAHAEPTSVWPVSFQTADIVLLSQPGVRHKCGAHEFTLTQLVCGKHRKVAYDRTDVAAIIEPPNHAGRAYRRTLLIIGAACVAGSFFVPVTAVVILLRVLGSVISLEAFNPGDDGDHEHDIVLYRLPDTELSVAVR